MRWRRCCASSRSSAGSIRATSRWSRSAVADRCTPARSPRSSASARVIVPRASGPLLRARLAGRRAARQRDVRSLLRRDERDGSDAVDRRRLREARRARARQLVAQGAARGDHLVSPRVRRALPRTELRADDRRTRRAASDRAALSSRASRALRLRRPGEAVEARQRAGSSARRNSFRGTRRLLGSSDRLRLTVAQRRATSRPARKRVWLDGCLRRRAGLRARLVAQRRPPRGPGDRRRVRLHDVRCAAMVAARRRRPAGAASARRR